MQEAHHSERYARYRLILTGMQDSDNHPNHHAGAYSSWERVHIEASIAQQV